MKICSKRFLVTLLGTGTLIMMACASAPVLQSKAAVPPTGVNLSGYWLAREASRVAELPGQQARSESIVSTSRQSRSSRRRESRPTGSPVEVFLEFGESLKISQTNFGLFISYDRAIVEEYTFGENREITVGPIEAQRVSGWDGESFSVATLDRKGNILFESWQLQQNDATLLRKIEIKHREKILFATTERFDRVFKSGDDSSSNLAGR